jgi:choline-sulfatase
MKKKNKIKRLIGLFGLSLLVIMIFIIYLFILHPNGSQKIKHFILISLDDLRAERLGCYGNERNASPVIDRLADEGIKFNAAFVSYPFTPPSHASMFTSLYPSVFDIPLDGSIPTLASVFSEDGFRTAAFTENGYMTEGYGVLNGFNERDDHVRNLDQTEKKALSWLESNKDQNFFLFLHTYYIHVPFEGPDLYFEQFANPDYSGPLKNKGESVREFMVKANSGEISVTPEDIQRIFDIYDSQIRRADDFIFSLVQKLKDLDLYNKTMLIITSDHGEQLFEFGHFGHSSPANPFADISTRVPLIIHCPTIQNQASLDGLTEMIDLAPTILEAAGIKSPKSFQGHSMYSLLVEKKSRSKFGKKEIFFTEPRFWGIRTESQKLIFDTLQGKTYLYDLKTDPGEKINMLQNVSSNKQARSMIEKFIAFQEKNSEHRQKIGIKKISLAEELTENPLKTDDHTNLFTPLDSDSYYLRQGETVEQHPFQIANLSFADGRNGKSILFKPEGKIVIPLELSLFSNPGAIEFWIKIEHRFEKFQRLLDINFKSSNSSLQLFSNIVRAPEQNHLQRSSFQLFRDRGSENEKSLFFASWFHWNQWNHVLLAWNPGEVLLLVNGILSSRIQNLSEDLFRLGIVSSIEMQGQNCRIDDFRISTQSRLTRYETQKRHIDKTVRDKLKALGYIR